MDIEKLDNLPEQICEVFKRKTGHNGGNVYFSYRNKQDYLALSFYNGKLKDVLVKNKNCKKEDSIEWTDSEFSGFSQREAFLEFSEQIEKIIIEEQRFSVSWVSLFDFLGWLNAQTE